VLDLALAAERELVREDRMLRERLERRGGDEALRVCVITTCTSAPRFCSSRRTSHAL
jgi:hypothetical protein